MTRHPSHQWDEIGDGDAICDLCAARIGTVEAQEECRNELADVAPAAPPEGWENWPTGILYEGDMSDVVATMWRLIFADDPAEIDRLETSLQGTQAEAVDSFIEQSCWGRDVPALVGGRGTPAERLAELRAAYIAAHATA
jgi:hypothetical protein